MNSAFRISTKEKKELTTSTPHAITKHRQEYTHTHTHTAQIALVVVSGRLQLQSGYYTGGGAHSTQNSTMPRKRAREDDDGSARAAKPAKKTKADETAKAGRDSEGNPYWQASHRYLFSLPPFDGRFAEQRWGLGGRRKKGPTTMCPAPHLRVSEWNSAWRLNGAKGGEQGVI